MLKTEGDSRSADVAPPVRPLCLEEKPMGDYLARLSHCLPDMRLRARRIRWVCFLGSRAATKTPAKKQSRTSADWPRRHRRLSSSASRVAARSISARSSAKRCWSTSGRRGARRARRRCRSWTRWPDASRRRGCNHRGLVDEDQDSVRTFLRVPASLGADGGPRPEGQAPGAAAAGKMPTRTWSTPKGSSVTSTKGSSATTSSGSRSGSRRWRTEAS